MEDMSYSLLMSDFIELARNRIGRKLDLAEMHLLRDMFMGGAACALGRIRERPATEETMLDELEDFCNERGAAERAA